MPEQRVFHHSLYRPAAIAAAAEAYAGLAEVTLEPHAHETRVHLRPLREDLADVLADAFANHVLHATVQAHRAGSET